MDAILHLGHQWIFKCHFCKQEFYDPVAIGIHFDRTHNFILKSDLVQ